MNSAVEGAPAGVWGLGPQRGPGAGWVQGGVHGQGPGAWRCPWQGPWAIFAISRGRGLANFQDPGGIEWPMLKCPLLTKIINNVLIGGYWLTTNF